MIYAYDDDQLAAALWPTRLRFREVAGQDEYDEYMLCAISDASKAAGAIRADLLSLCARMRYLYTFTPTVGAQRNHISRLVGVLTVIMIAGFLWLYVHFTKPGAQFVDVEAFTLVVFAGAIGGFISIQQRLQQPSDVDPLFKELELATSGLDTLVSPLLGAIFAAVLYLVFVSNLISGDLFPKFPCDGHFAYGPDFGQFVRCAVPATPGEWGKLAVWGFIAGSPSASSRTFSRAWQPVASATRTLPNQPRRRHRNRRIRTTAFGKRSRLRQSNSSHRTRRQRERLTLSRRR